MTKRPLTNNSKGRRFKCWALPQMEPADSNGSYELYLKCNTPKGRPAPMRITLTAYQMRMIADQHAVYLKAALLESQREIESFRRNMLKHTDTSTPP